MSPLAASTDALCIYWPLATYMPWLHLHLWAPSKTQHGDPQVTDRQNVAVGVHLYGWSSDPTEGPVGLWESASILFYLVILEKQTEKSPQADGKQKPSF